jgi:hypothetical protein
MMKKSLFLFLVFLLTACSAGSVTPTITQTQIINTPIPNTNTPAPPTFTNTPINTPTITATRQQQLGILTNQSPDQIATALNLQIDEMQVTLTSAAERISTLDSQEATLALAATAGSLPTSTPISGYNIPSNVYIVTIIDDAFLEVPNGINENGAPIMQQVKPLIRLDLGFQTWVYKDKIQADGGGKYYRVFDPDGESSGDYHLRAIDIQIRLPNGRPTPSNYPTEVVKSHAISSVIAYFVYGYDSNGKPIMEALTPRITYGPGEMILVYAERVIATGGMHFLAVYDPDGNPSAFLVAEKIEIARTWD